MHYGMGIDFPKIEFPKKDFFNIALRANVEKVIYNDPATIVIWSA